MPFTLAHPAAILPLRGLRYLRTAPLILGAMIPDLPYYLPGAHRMKPDTHSVVGSFTIDLVLGYAALLMVFVLRAPLTALLPPRARWLCLNTLAPFSRIGFAPRLSANFRLASSAFSCCSFAPWSTSTWTA